MGRKSRNKRQRRALQLDAGFTPADWETIERALNEPDLVLVFVSEGLFEVLANVPDDPADVDEYLVLPPSVSGLVMVLGYDRPKDPWRFLTFDGPGSDFVMAFMLNPDWDLLKPRPGSGPNTSGSLRA